jgi:arylsulfatase A-like enzyme
MISMDWMPTLLAAAGTQMDSAYPPDGENLLPTLISRPAPHPRKLYWRYKAGTQRAIRDHDWKYLRIAGNEFLFDVVKDQRERANYKDREKDVFGRLKADWDAWRIAGRSLRCDEPKIERWRQVTVTEGNRFVAPLRRARPSIRSPVRRTRYQLIRYRPISGPLLRGR